MDKCLEKLCGLLEVMENRMFTLNKTMEQYINYYKDGDECGTNCGIVLDLECFLSLFPPFQQKLRFVRGNLAESLNIKSEDNEGFLEVKNEAESHEERVEIFPDDWDFDQVDIAEGGGHDISTTGKIDNVAKNETGNSDSNRDKTVPILKDRVKPRHCLKRKLSGNVANVAETGKGKPETVRELRLVLDRCDKVVERVKLGTQVRKIRGVKVGTDKSDNEKAGCTESSFSSEEEYDHVEDLKIKTRQKCRQSKKTDLVLTEEQDKLLNLDISSLPGPPYLCPAANCGMGPYIKGYLQRHIYKFHLAGVRKPCPECGLKYRPRSIRRHILAQHPDVFNQLYTPASARLIEPEQFGFTAEQLVNPDNSKFPYRCPICHRPFLVRATLLHHTDTHHAVGTKNPSSLLCPQCGKTWKNAWYLKRHIETAHEKNKKHVCDLCNKAFVWKISLKKHKIVEHQVEPEVMCSQCGAWFRHISFLKKHVKSVHQQIRPHKCNLCEKSFKEKTHLQYHLKTHDNGSNRKRGLNQERRMGAPVRCKFKPK